MEYNVQQESRVWNRVMGAPRQETPHTCTDAESIMGQISRKTENVCLYRTLACRVCPACRGVLLELAAEESCVVKELSAIYFVMTGRKACPPAAQKPCITCTAETLRQQYAAVLEDAKRYEAMAVGEFAYIFCGLAQASQKHAKKLLCVMGDAV